MTNIALNTGLKSILTAQYALATIGHNIANANTPGYSRQRVSIGADLPLQVRGILVGGGVRADEVRRSVDALLNRRITAQGTVQGRLESRLTSMTEIESLLGELDGHGLGSQLDGLFSAFSALSTDPQDAILKSGVTQAAVSIASRFNGISSSLSDLRRDTSKELGVRVAEVNQMAHTIRALNEEILRYEGGGIPANDLRDQRDLVLSELAKRVDVRASEDAQGALRVTVAGNMLVSSAQVYELSVAQGPNGDPKLKIQGADGFVPVTGGTIGGLLGMAADFVPGLDAELDRFARNLILEMNRVHSTGMPSGGPFHNLVGSNPVLDLDKDGKRTDELLSKAGLPFDVKSGLLHVNVTEAATGEVTQHSIAISASHTTVGEFLDAISAIPHVSADLDGFGRVQIVAEGGFGFDFSPRIDPNPDAVGSFGGGKASLGSGQGPFALSDGDTLTLAVPAGGTAFTISFATADFKDINHATAAEIAAVINADPNAQTLGLAAADVNGHLFVQTLGSGQTASFSVEGGSVLGDLGFSAGQTVKGSDNAVDVQIGGVYQGDHTDVYTFVPNMDGTVGTTPGLVVDVYDGAGNLVASLNVGEGYVPGTEIGVAQGVTASFGLGELSASDGDLFALDVIDDSDSADVLVALGINSFFTGTGAADIALRKDLEADPSLIATSLTGAPGDNQTMLALLGLQNVEVGGLASRTFGQFYGDTIGGFGFEVSSTVSALESNDSLRASLDRLRESVSGVNVDEELVDMVRFEQAFAAASRFVTVVNDLQQELLNLI